MAKVDYEAQLPERMKRLPRDKHGRPVPWFVAEVNGEPDFRVLRPTAIMDAYQQGRCWVCGDVRGSQRGTFVIGPMCCINRVSAEPPSHLECAVYSAKHCPFLTVPKMHRRENNLPEDVRQPDGIMIARNPGVTLVWTSRNWNIFANKIDGRFHYLFNVGDPETVQWYAEGREATHAEVQHAIDTGLPQLREMAYAQGSEAVEQLTRMTFDAVATLPAS